MQLREDVKTLVEENIAAMIPLEMSVEAFNADYIQRHPGSAAALLGYAKALAIIHGKNDEVDGALAQMASNAELEMSIQVSAAEPIRR